VTNSMFLSVYLHCWWRKPFEYFFT